jgi:polyhydroxybutyrate depolymerase
MPYDSPERSRRLRAASVTTALVALIATALLLVSCGSSSRASLRAEVGANAPARLADASAAPAEGEEQVARLAPIVFVPPRLPAGKVPLLIVLHGSGGTPQGMVATTGFDRLAAANGFIVAYLGSGSPGDNWKLPSDTTYVGSMIDHLEATEPIDPARVYVTGYSAGGYESYRVGCLLSDKVAAIAPDAVSMNPTLYATCRPVRPVSTLITIGSADTEHFGGHSRLPSAPAAAARWRMLDGCAPGTASSSQASGPTSQQLWSGCADDSAVGLDIVQGGVHIWPGPRLGAGTPDGRYEASQAIWAFFAGLRAGSLHTPDARLSSLRVLAGGEASQLVLTLHLGGPVTVHATFTRRGHRVASVLRPLARAGTSRLALALARGGGGTYVASIVITDRYGRSLTVKRTVVLPGAPV